MTNNREESKIFYQKVLGLPFDFEDAFGSVFKLKDASLRITESKGFVPSPHPILGWEVDDIKSSVQTITANGAKMDIYEGFGQDSLGIWHSPDEKSKLAWFKDIDGNVLCLMAKK